MATKYIDRKGVQVIHLDGEVWRIGKLNYMKRTKRPHIVIYSPEDKLFHVYDKLALSLCRTTYDYDDNEVILTDRMDVDRVRHYIRTMILK